MESNKNQTPRPAIAGILAIISGAFYLIMMIYMTVATSMKGACPVPGVAMNHPYGSWMMIVLTILGILAIVGGIFALKRKYFCWAVTGCAAAALPFSLLGLASIILVALSHDEFEACS